MQAALLHSNEEKEFLQAQLEKADCGRVMCAADAEALDAWVPICSPQTLRNGLVMVLYIYIYD